MIDIHDDLYKDMEAVRQIPVVPTMLEVICQTTGMGFAAIARVTQDRWLACSVRDEVAFGLEAGGELKIETTICNEIRDHRRPVIIDNVAADPHYCLHHTPKLYGLQSYISVPIILKNGEFFGTLCAIDSKPAQINNPIVIGTFTMFAELLAFHLQSLDLLERSQQAQTDLQQENRILTEVNTELDDFVFSASHDLKSPLYNIESLLEILTEAIAQDPIEREEVNGLIQMLQTNLKSFGRTIEDLTTFVEINLQQTDEKPEEVNIFEVVEHVKQDLNKLIEDSQARIKVVGQDKLTLNFSKKNFRSTLYNLLSNAIKYRSPERTPEVLVKMEKVDGKINLSVSDNGVGIPTDKQDMLFTMFKRFHSHVEGSGLGLYIVKRLVDNHKGQIQVDSTLNRGTTFTITF